MYELRISVWVSHRPIMNDHSRFKPRWWTVLNDVLAHEYLIMRGMFGNRSWKVDEWFGIPCQINIHKLPRLTEPFVERRPTVFYGEGGKLTSQTRARLYRAQVLETPEKNKKSSVTNMVSAWIEKTKSLQAQHPPRRINMALFHHWLYMFRIREPPTPKMFGIFIHLPRGRKETRYFHCLNRRLSSQGFFLLWWPQTFSCCLNGLVM